MKNMITEMTDIMMKTDKVGILKLALMVRDFEDNIQEFIKNHNIITED